MLTTMRSRITAASAMMLCVALFAASGDGAYAATRFVGANGTVHGCVSKKGKLTVLKRGTRKCPKRLTKISWNRTGLAGPAGQAGQAGQAGAPGLQGAKGDKGDTGPAEGPAGGALVGSFPNPALNVSGGPCARGKFLTDLSTLSALTCGPFGTLITALGDNALASNTTGDENTAVGRDALKTNTSGCCSTGVGENALEKSTGCCNAATGADALGENTTGFSNSAFGESALNGNSTGSNNSAVGENAMWQSSSGSNNSAVGQAALERTTGESNSALGSQALKANTVGSDNIAVGRLAGGNLTTGSFNIDIGNQGVAGEAGTIRIGTPAAQTQTFLAGVDGAGVDQNTPVLVGSDGKLGTAVSSSRRFKTDIHPLRRLGRLMRLRPVSYRYKPRWAGGDSRVRYGLIAEEVAKVFPALVQRSPDGKPNGVRYGDLPVLLLAQLQREHAHTRRLRRRINQQQRHVDRLAAHVRALARRR